MKPTARGGGHAWLATTVAAACAAAAAGQGIQSYSIKYVDADAPGGDGSTWGNAYNNLESALAAARLVNVNEIRVGGGSTASPDVYTPSAGGSGRNVRFDLVPAVRLRGGFAGWNAGSPDTFDPDTYISVLSGEIGSAGLSDNCYHVVVANGSSLNYLPSTILEGFRVESGFADAAYSPTVPSPDAGGGLFLYNAAITVRRCYFTGNGATRGGAVYHKWKNTEEDTRFVRCTFDSNYILEPAAGSSNSLSAGGGIFSYEGSIRVINCTFFDNVPYPPDPPSGALGGGVYIEYAATPGEDDLTPFRFMNCLFYDNEAADGAAVYNKDHTYVEILNTTIVSNDAEDDVGGYYNDTTATAEIFNSIFWDNTDSAGSSQAESAQLWAANASGDIVVSETDIEGLSAYSGNGNINSDPDFVAAGTPNFNYRLEDTSPCIDNGDGNDIPPDEGDLDGDSNVDEDTPFDLDMNTRLVDGDSELQVDMGCYEFEGGESAGPAQPPVLRMRTFVEAMLRGHRSADHNRDRLIDVRDLASFHRALLEKE